MIHDKEQANRALRGGIVAGLVGGLALTIYMLVLSAATGQDAWMMLKGAGTPFLGERAMAPGFDGPAVLVGLLSHFAVSVIWGAGFGLLFYGLSRNATIGAGALWGLVVWIGMYYVVLPIVGLGSIAASVPLVPAILEHMVFGVILGVAFLPFQRRVLRPGTIGRPLPH